VNQFKPYQGKSACQDDGKRCLTCGRTLVEIIWLRELMDQLANHMDYVHYNPVKYGHAASAWDWPFSSFWRLVGEGMCPLNWVAEGEVLDAEWECRLRNGGG
jgi:hypothetical protein